MVELLEGTQCAIRMVVREGQISFKKNQKYR